MYLMVSLWQSYSMYKNFVIDDSPELKRYVLLVDEELLFVVRQFLTLKTSIQASLWGVSALS